MKNSNDKKNKIIKIILVVATLGFIVNSIFSLTNDMRDDVKISDNYTQIYTDINNNKVASVVMLEKKTGVREITVTPVSGAIYKLTGSIRDEKLINELVSKNIKTKVEEEPPPSWFSSFFYSWGPTVFFLAVWIFVMRKMMSGSAGGKGLFSFNKSKAQLIDPSKIEVGFKDVVGCDEAKREVQEFVEFFKNPELFQKLGGRIPRGLLLTGPAGTGKTLLVKVLAKESQVPFFHMSGSDFVEMFAGVGASRVRDMFETAKKVAPCVLFIDEIDAIGGKRNQGSFSGAGGDEREQTLNQLLVEMDGMGTHSNIIVVGATNRPEVLDPALLRPGRFDRQVVVSLPDVIGRESMLKTHIELNKVPIGIEVDLHRIARGTPGFSGAEIANLINEAAIFAGRRKGNFVEQVDLENAKDKIMMGPERPSLAMTEEDKRETAYHEAGHTVIAKTLKNSDPIYKVTIIPRGRALGLTQQLPDKDRFSYKKEYLLDRITILMGGRAAELVFCDTLTTGASNDIAVATSTVRSMIMEWGMSSLGPIGFASREQSHLGSSLQTNNLSETTMLEIDKEVSRIVNEEAEKAIQILKDNYSRVEAMTDALMEIETLDDWQVENIMNDLHYNDNAGMLVFKANSDKKIKDEKDRKDLRKIKINSKSVENNQNASLVVDIETKL